MRSVVLSAVFFFFFFQAEDGIRDKLVTGVQTCALPISLAPNRSSWTGSEPTWRVTFGPGSTRPHATSRSGEGRVGEEGRSRGAADHLKKKKRKETTSAYI